MNKRWVWICGVAFVAMVLGWSACSGPNVGAAPGVSPAAGGEAANPVIAMGPSNGCSVDVMNADGSNLASILGGCYGTGWASWSPDGKHIAYSRNDFLSTGTVYDLWRADVSIATTGKYKGQPVASNAYVLVSYPTCNPDCFRAAWSPDGTKIAFDSENPGGTTPERIMTVPATGGTPTTLVTAPDAHTEYATMDWRSDGTELAVATYYCNGCAPSTDTDSIQIFDGVTGALLNTLLSGQIHWDGSGVSWARGLDILAYGASPPVVGGVVGPPAIYTLNLANCSPTSCPTTLVTAGGTYGAMRPSWSPNNTQLVYINRSDAKFSDGGAGNVITLATGATSTFIGSGVLHTDWRR